MTWMTWWDWVSVSEIPVFIAAGGWLLNRIYGLREEITVFKLDVAKNYASIEYLKDVEDRLLKDLENLDQKLDRLIERGQGGG